MSLNHVTLDDKYDLTKSRVFVTGYQALVRLTLMQHERDKRAGLNTAGYVTGYRGSPLGGLDYQFQRAISHLAPRHVVFQPGINEDLAATALWGSLNHVTLDDKYDLTKSRVFVTGYQALVRLTLMQHERDRRAGLNTAGYVTGYRGSPLGGLD